MNSPTHQEKLAFIREKCIEANPEIVELKFGCRVEGNKEHPFLLYVGNNKGQLCLMIEDNQALLFVEKLGNVKVIGRPIRLADVLLAVGRYEKCRCGFDYNNSGVILINDWHNTHPRAEWNLRKDDLNEQDEATISFLYEILT